MIRIEGRTGKYMYLLVIRRSLLGLWIVLKLEDLCRKHGVSIHVHESNSVIIDEEYIDRIIKEKLEKIPPHLLYHIKKALIERRLPRGKNKEEVIEAMKV